MAKPNPIPSLDARGPIYKAFHQAMNDPELALGGVALCVWWLVSFSGHPSAEPDDRRRMLSPDERSDWFRMYRDEEYSIAQVDAVLPPDDFKQVMARCRDARSMTPLFEHSCMDAMHDSLAGLFLRRVFSPYVMWHERSPWTEFAAAATGDEAALKRLVMIDRLVLEAPEIVCQWQDPMQADRLLRERVAHADLNAIDDKYDLEHRSKTGKLRFTQAVRTRKKLRFAAHLQLWAQRQGKRLMPRHIRAIFDAIHDEFRASDEARCDLPAGDSLRVELSRIRSRIEPKQSPSSG